MTAKSTAAQSACTNGAKALTREPVQYRYQLAQWVAERRPNGWYIAKAWTTSNGEKPKWEGPYPFPEDAAISIALYLCAELSNRHMAKAKFHQIKFGNSLYGLPPPPDLSRTRKKRGRPMATTPSPSPN